MLDDFIMRNWEGKRGKPHAGLHLSMERSSSDKRRSFFIENVYKTPTYR